MRIILCGVLAASVLVASTTAKAADHCMTTNEGTTWKASYPTIYSKLLTYFTCQGQGDPVACNVFVARSAEGIFGVKDFKRPDGSYMAANTIMDVVRNNPAWSKLGPANSQAALNDASSGAEDHLIIAVMRDEPHGHVALVLPGTPLYSGNWKLNTPNSASAFLGNVERAYVFCRLSWAFTDPSKVELWWRPAAR